MTTKSLKTICSLTILALIAACSQNTERRPQPAGQRITNAAMIGDVVAMLERGDTETARARLTRMTKREPGDHDARLLLESIDGDPVMMLGAKSFAYTLRRDDTLFSLSREHLGSPYKFYALSRYNGLSNPSAVKVGQTIRIPGDAPRVAKPAAPVPSTRRSEPPSQITTKPKATPAPPPSDPARAARLRGAGLAALNRGQAGAAVTLLTQASAAQPGNAAIARDLARAKRIAAAVKARN